MRSTRIYTNQDLAPGATVTLPEDASRHVSRVLRMQQGDPLVIFSGSGGEYNATIELIEKKSVCVVLQSHNDIERESALNIQLGIALSRGDRFDWVVQKATELGVARISPLLTERTGVKLTSERAQKKARHWQQISASACEQCGRNRLPVIDSIESTTQWLHNTHAQKQFVLHTQVNNVRELAEADTVQSVALLVGPEGGLSDAEIEAASTAGYLPLQLGPRVLRTETAPVAAITFFQTLWGDFLH